jgi:hypothetical protein
MGAYGQLIPLKTAPIATGSQFQLYPSHARGMGGVTLAVDDTQGDAFVNPAMAARLNGTWAENQYVTPLGGRQLTGRWALAGRIQWGHRMGHPEPPLHGAP